jgi:hypothetical protein
MNCQQRIGAVVLALTLAPAAWAGASQSLSEAQQRYQQERAQCLSGQSQEDRATCLKEAGAAYQEARNGRLDNSQANNFTQNATQRCNAQPASDREACVQRIVGTGSAQGSVNGGGILREVATPVK